MAEIKITTETTEPASLSPQACVLFEDISCSMKMLVRSHLIKPIF